MRFMCVCKKPKKLFPWGTLVSTSGHNRIENEFTVIPRFTSQLVPKNDDLNRMTTQIEVRGNKKFYDLNRNNLNRGNINRRITVTQLNLTTANGVLNNKQ